MDNQIMTMKPLLTPDEIRRGIEHYAAQENPWEISVKARGAITGAIVRAIKSTGITDQDDIDWNRYLLIGYLVLPLHEKLRPVSSKELTAGQWMGFSRWQSERLDNGTYQERPTFTDEVCQVLYRARQDDMIAQGQLPLFGLWKRWEHEVPQGDHYDIPEFYQFVLDTLPITPQGIRLKELLTQEIQNE